MAAADARWKRPPPLLLLAAALALVSLALVVSDALGGHQKPWTSWTMPLLILGNVTLMASSLPRTRPRLTNWLWAVSIAIALVTLFEQVRTR
jgi:hypothetical protein